MHNSKAVIQKIEDDGRVTLYQCIELLAPWSFESYREAPHQDAHPDIFPFVFDVASRFSVAKAGSETQVQLRPPDVIWFADDYGVPEGMLVGILFPRGFVPEVFKFKQKPHIPAGVANGTFSPPGHVELRFNHSARQAAVTFHITRTSYFGFKCIARCHDAEFPYNPTFTFAEELFGTLASPDSISHATITRQDLQKYKPIFKESADLDELAGQMTELIRLCRNNQSTEEMKSARSSATRTLADAIGTAGSLTTLFDSYRSGGVVFKLLAYLLL